LVDFKVDSSDDADERMKQVNDSNPATLLAAMTCLADDTRLRLLRLLEQQELGVGELGQVLRLPQPTVSRHLKTLSEAGFVISRREGTSNLYRMLLDELQPGARELWVVAREHTKGWPELGQDEKRLGELLREKASASRAFFAGAAVEWDRLREELYGGGVSGAAMMALLPEGAVVADLGCGTGSVAAGLAGYVGEVVAVDNSPEMLSAARERCAGMGNVKVREGELTRVPVESGTCDAVILVLALTYVAEPAAVIAEAARLLKPVGKVVLVDLLPHGREDFRRKMNQLHAGFDRRQVGEMFEAAGLRVGRHQALVSPAEAKGPGLFVAVGVGSDSEHTEMQRSQRGKHE